MPEDYKTTYKSILHSRPTYSCLTGWIAVLIPVTLVMAFIPFSIGIFSHAGSNVALKATWLIVMLGLFALGLKVYFNARRVKKLLERRPYLGPRPINFNSHIAKTVVKSEYSGDSGWLHFKIFKNLRFETIDDLALIGQPDWPPSVLGEKADYRLHDMAVDIYRRGRYGTYKTSEEYYTILEIKLRKPVPHLVFDSKSAKRKQFRAIYASGQRLSASASFEKYFSLYSPRHHSIEALSFITPEVIEAMIGLRDCDFEFIEDSLFCYAPLLNEVEMANLRRRGLLLHAKVNDNLPRYTFTDSQVDEFGRQLLKNPWRYLPSALFSGAMAGWLWFSIFSEFDLWLSVVAAVCTLASLFLFWAIVDEKRKNKRLEEEFLRRRQWQ